jgi:hypothetical protein
MGGVGAVAAAVAAFMVWILNIDGRGEGLPGLLAVLMWLTTMLTTAWLIASAERRMADQLDRVEAMRYRDGYVDGYLDAATRRRARVEDG